MDKQDLGQILALGITSGLVAGIVNQLAAYLRERATRKFDEASRQADRQHQALLERQAAHAQARIDLLPYVADARQWVQFRWGREFGLDSDYHGSNLSAPRLSGVAEVIDALDYVAVFHPTEPIRRKVGRLRDGIDDRHNSIDGHTGAQPDDGDYRQWMDSLEEVIEGMHRGP